MIPLAKPFRPRPYDPGRPDARTDAQKRAGERNFEIFKLRGLWAQAGMLADPYRTAVRALIDGDLVARGALNQSDHQHAQWLERVKRRGKPQPELEDDIPF